MKICLIGGHLTPALAVCDEIANSHPEWELVFIGREYSQDSLRQKAHERSEAEKRGMRFVPFVAPRVQGASIIQRLKAIVPGVISIITAIQLLSNERPDVLITFGGYLAVPLSFAAKLRGIPIITHEQTRHPGQANRLISKWAHYVGVSFPETVADFPAHKAVYVGNPLRRELFNSGSFARAEQMNGQELPLVVILGGNQGSAFLNDRLPALLPQLLTRFRVIHQCGNATQADNYRQQLESFRHTLSEDLQQRYLVQEWFTTTELAWLYHHATLAISRAGANTIYELIIFSVPSILIPLPHSAAQEQLDNATWLAKHGGAQVLLQSAVTEESVSNLIDEVCAVQQQMRSVLQKIELPTDAALRLTHLIERIGKNETPSSLN